MNISNLDLMENKFNINVTMSRREKKILKKLRCYRLCLFSVVIIKHVRIFNYLSRN